MRNNLILATVIVATAFLSCSIFAPIVPYGELDSELQTIESPQPSYPEEARQNEEQGTVIVKVLVGTGGKVERTEIEQSSGYDDLDDAARNATKKWVFSEPTKDGEPVRTWVSIPFTFTLEQ